MQMIMLVLCSVFVFVFLKPNVLKIPEIGSSVELLIAACSWVSLRCRQQGAGEVPVHLCCWFCFSWCRSEFSVYFGKTVLTAAAWLQSIFSNVAYFKAAAHTPSSSWQHHRERDAFAWVIWSGKNDNIWQKKKKIEKPGGQPYFHGQAFLLPMPSQAACWGFSETINISPMQICSAAAKKATHPCACPGPLLEIARKMYGAVTSC